MREGSNSHLLVALGLLVIQSASAPAAELTTKGIDRLGRPVTNAVVAIALFFATALGYWGDPLWRWLIEHWH